jgi:hypothetical protein
MTFKKNITRLDHAIQDTQLSYEHALQRQIILTAEINILKRQLDTLCLIRDDKDVYKNDVNPILHPDERDKS